LYTVSDFSSIAFIEKKAPLRGMEGRLEKAYSSRDQRTTE